MESGVEKLAAICILVTSLSHIIQPRAWAEFFIMLREKGLKTKTVGIVGGLAPESTIEYYRQIINSYREHSSAGKLSLDHNQQLAA